MESNFRILFIESFGYHIKSKHDVFSDGTEQKCLHFSQVSFWDGISKEKKNAISLQHNGLCMALVSRYLTRLFLHFNLQMAKFVMVLLTFPETEASDRKWQKSAHQC